MAGLDRGDGARGAEDAGLEDVGDLAEVGRDAGVLEHLSGRGERRRVRDGLAEVELRRLDRGRAERALEELHVRGLVLGDDLGELLEVRVGAVRGVRHGLLVERGLEELERQREVQDVDVVLLGLLLRDRGLGDAERREERATGDEPAAGDRAALDERAAVDADGLGGVADGAVGVDEVKVEQIRQGTLLGWCSEVQRTVMRPVIPGCSVH